MIACIWNDPIVIVCCQKSFIYLAGNTESRMANTIINVAWESSRRCIFLAEPTSFVSYFFIKQIFFFYCINCKHLNITILWHNSLFGNFLNAWKSLLNCLFFCWRSRIRNYGRFLSNNLSIWCLWILHIFKCTSIALACTFKKSFWVFTDFVPCSFDTRWVKVILFKFFKEVPSHVKAFATLNPSLYKCKCCS